jgi:hypothetical protein
MCGHGYQAADHMAGRRVRCKHCGNTFQLPSEVIDASTPFQRPDLAEPTPPAGVPLKPDPLAPPSRANAAAAAVIAAAAKKPPLDAIPVDDDEADDVPVRAAPHAAHAPAAPPAARGGGAEESDPEADAFLQDAPDDVFDAAFQQFAPARGNTPFVFPGSMFLDRYLPAILVALLVPWLAYLAIGNKDEPGWVGVVRLLILLMTYASVVFPACLTGVRMAARKLNYELPSGAPWRAFATFLLPTTLGCAMWLSSRSPGGLIFGTALGLVVGLPVMWLLFRIRPDDAPVSLGYGAGAFGAGMLAAVVLLSLLNLILYGVVKGTQAKHTLTMSPFGPGFMWDGATIQRPKPAVRPGGDGTDDGQLASGDPNLGPPPEGTPPGDGPPGDTGEGTPAPPPDGGEAPKGEKDFSTDMVDQGAAPDAGPAHGPIVAEAHLRFQGEMRHVVYPLIPGSAVAVVKKGKAANEDDLELWDAANWKPTAGARFVRATGLPNEYTLSSDGSYVARIATHPQLSAQVYSFANDQLLRPIIKLDREGLDAHVLGFRTPDQVVLQYQKGRGSRVEIWDVDSAKRLVRLEVGGFRPEPGNFALSRNGNLLAMIVREQNQPGRLDVYDLSAGALASQLMVEPLSAAAADSNLVRTRGVAFNDAGDRVAALFDRKGEGLMLCWGPGQLPMHEYALPAGYGPTGVDPAEFAGEALALLDDGRAWSVYGTRVYDMATGDLLGDIGIDSIVAQRVTGPSSLLLLQQLDGNSRALIDVRLDIARARSGADGLE